MTTNLLLRTATVVAICLPLYSANVVHTASGALQGTVSSDGKVQIYEGIPYGAPPVGDLRWKPPQPAAQWEGVRKAKAFGPRCMQARIFDDMVFRDDGPSEDCLYLNVWTPATSADNHLPVMVWIYGGGFQAGSPSEPRQNGENLAKKGVIVVSMNYRLGVFGFLAHPELTKESAHHASGNYGYLDQLAALRWVHDNIAAFGGDPAKVTIFGESAGSISVSAQMASPLSKGLFARAIGESGGVFGYTEPPPSLEASEQMGAKFAAAVSATSLKDLRAISAKELLDDSTKDKTMRFWPNVDGYFFPEHPWRIYAQGDQAHVPLLAGWNTDESTYRGVLGKAEPTKANYIAKLEDTIGKEKAEQVLKYYPAGDDEQAKISAGQLAGDRFIAYSTWKWLEEQTKTGKAPVYRYHFEQPPPMPTGEPSHGAYHSADIEYVFETIDWKKLAWTADDRKLSDLISSYWTNFAKAGDPNGAELPKWPAYNDSTGFAVMHLNATPAAAPDSTRDRYLMIDRMVRGRIEERTQAAKKE
ncbi:MAG TPA: carboxylesterase/lipase family protein [Bryobacteraceae bacterium]|jgi:para-nitrobenzyl esterase|nr:carboxylesterase/lipase family protein [Bryobacteraceae bacterium]